MTYIVTTDVDTEDESSTEVRDDDLGRLVLELSEALVDGAAFQVRRADYLDVSIPAAVLSGRTKGHLTLIQGGKNGKGKEAPRTGTR